MKYLISAIVAIVIIGLVAIDPILSYSTKSVVQFTVNDKAAVINNHDSQYLIYTTAGVYEDSDSLWYWKWNSSDVYNQLERGSTYTATVYGFRIPFLSLYKNIVTVSSKST